MVDFDPRSQMVRLSLLVMTVLLCMNPLTGGSDGKAGKAVEKEAETEGVHFDMTMAERGIEWLKFIKKGADEPEMKRVFLQHVAPTRGCRAIVHHWARFMEWDNEAFYRFIAEAMGRIPSKREIRNEDGTLTRFGARRELWTHALDHIEELEQRVRDIKAVNFAERSLGLAKKYLPETATIQVDFYFVLFGGSNAFAVGKENGLDLLQIPLTDEGKPDIDEISLIIAHELHHRGFSSAADLGMKEVQNEKNIMLLGILAAEGMPTYFIDKPFNHLDRFRASDDPLTREVASDWEKHSARLPELYREAERDLGRNLAGEMSQEQIMKTWLAGAKGAAYVLGCDMMSVIHRYLGLESALSIANDYRTFLAMYNRAALKANQNGEKRFVFNHGLVKNVLIFKKWGDAHFSVNFFALSGSNRYRHPCRPWHSPKGGRPCSGNT